MKTQTSFITQCWHVNQINNKIDSLLHGVPEVTGRDLSQYVGDIPVRPISIFITVREPSGAEIELHKTRHPNWHVFNNFVSICFEFEWSISDVAFYSSEKMHNLPPKVYDEVLARRFAVQGSSIAQRFIILINISIAGFCSSRFSINSSGNALFEEGSGCHSWLEHVFDAEKLIDSSPLNDASVTQCLSWGSKLGGLWNSLPRTNVERSLSYFSYIFSSDFAARPLVSAIWLIGALDAFYCDTAVGISEKLKKRVPLIITQLDADLLKKTLNEIYNDRSRLVHGDMAFSANFYDPYFESEIAATPLFLFPNISKLYYILLKTFGRCAATGAHEVSFIETPSFNTLSAT